MGSDALDLKVKWRKWQAERKRDGRSLGLKMAHTWRFTHAADEHESLCSRGCGHRLGQPGQGGLAPIARFHSSPRGAGKGGRIRRPVCARREKAPATGAGVER